MLYGYMGRNIFPIFTNFLTGVVVASVFIAIYYRYTTDRRRVLKVLGFEIVALSIVTIYFFLALYGVTHQSRESSTLVVGAMSIFFSMKLYGAGLERIQLVLRHKTGVYIPIHMVIMGSVNNFFWVVYTSLDSNWLMFGCCLTSGLLSVAQWILYFVYHPNGQRAAAAAAKAGAAVDRGVEDENGIPITVVVGSMAAASDAGKHAVMESPVFQALRSPLSPIHRHELQQQ